MEQHAVALLNDAEGWNWPPVAHIQRPEDLEHDGKYRTVIPRILSGIIVESNKFDGSMMNQFWVKLAECHPKVNENVTKLRHAPTSIPPENTTRMVLDGTQMEAINFRPLEEMAGEIFTHLMVAFVDPGSRKSKCGTPQSVSDVVRMDTDVLLKLLADVDEFGQRKQEVLEQLSFKRDGVECLLTGQPFNIDSEGMGIYPVLAHIIPDSFHKKSHTLELISMFAGQAVPELVTKHLDSNGNAISMQSDAREAFDGLRWGIEAQEVDDGSPTYTYRRVQSLSPTGIMTDTKPGPGFIRLRDGDRIFFGQGSDGKKLGHGPVPLLCNLRLAVARAATMSGAAGIIRQLIQEADDEDFPQICMTSEDFASVLTAKLLLVT